MPDLSNKVILVTGASKGIGAAIVRVLGENGASVIGHYGSDRAGAEAALAAVPRERKLVLGCDLRDLGAVERLWRDAVAWKGRIDVLVPNAAVLRFDGGFAESDAQWDAVWADTLQVNVMAVARLLRAAVKHYLERGGGSIVTISSWASQRGVTNPDTIAYAASKAAVKAATQTIARAYAKQGILAYVIAPGVVGTGMSERFVETQSGGRGAVEAGLTMGEWIPPEDIAHTVAFLASGIARHLTGATIDINGASYLR